MRKMKRSINLLACIILALVLNVCSDKMGDDEYFGFGFDELLKEWGFTYQNICPSVTDAIEYPEFWIEPNVDNLPSPSDETVHSMSTCGLLVTLLEYPLGVFMVPSSDLFQPRVSMFNNELQSNKVAVEFFNRGDFYPVLVSKYLSVIKARGYYEGAVLKNPINVHDIQWYLASDMCISALSEKEEIQLMAMALERTKYAFDNENIEPCLIMISIMKSYKYDPFMKDIEPRLIETMAGYTMCEPGFEPRFVEWMGYTHVVPDGTINTNILTSDHINIIIKYAKQFLNEQKI